MFDGLHLAKEKVDVLSKYGLVLRLSNRLLLLKLFVRCQDDDVLKGSLLVSRFDSGSLRSNL